jgi:predicted nucleotidyltransferase
MSKTNAARIHPIVEQHRAAIQDLCREFGVARLEVFGSATTDEFDPEHSDVDFIVEFPPDYDFGPWLTQYFDLKERLEALLGRPVDLVMASAMRKPRFIEAANETRQLLYAA